MNTNVAIKPIMERLLQSLELSLPEEVLVRLEELFHTLLQDPLYPSVSKIFDPEEIAAKHFLDSLAPLALPISCWPDRNGIVLDIGCGGGFPSLPLALVFPDSRVIAIDAKSKAVDFVGRVGKTMGLKNLQTRHARAEEAGRIPDLREKMDLVVCRAVAEIRVLLELGLPLVKLGGHLLLYKGPKLEEEMAGVSQAMEKLLISPADIRTFTLEPPRLPFRRGFVLIRKTIPTPAAFPRRNGVPSSKPL